MSEKNHEWNVFSFQNTSPCIQLTYSSEFSIGRIYRWDDILVYGTKKKKMR